MRLFDYSGEVAKIKPPRGVLAKPRLLLIHRSSVADGGVDTARWFAEQLGWRCPYHFYVNTGGTVQQLVPLRFQAPGAWLANRHAIHVAAAGDFRTETPTPDQSLALVELCTALVERWPDIKIDGHNPYKPGRSKNPLKQCPGERLNIEGLRNAVRSRCESLRSGRAGSTFA